MSTCSTESHRAILRHFAETAGLATVVRRRVSELAKTVIEKLDTLRIAHPDALNVAQISRDRSEKTIPQFLG
jgi:hypothetical protein